MIKVAHILTKGINGGVESIVYNYFKNIDRSKISFDIFIENESKIINKDNIEKLGGTIHIIPKYTNPIKYVRHLMSIFRKNNYDIIHSNLSTMSFLSLFAAKHSGIKKRVVHSHSTGSKNDKFKTFFKKMFAPISNYYGTHYIGCGLDAANFQFGKKRVKNNQVYILNNAIDYERFSFNVINREAVRKQYNIKDSDFLVGHIGRFCVQKNQIFLPKLFEKIVTLNPNIKLILIGDGEKYDEIQKEFSDKGIIDRVIFEKATAFPEKIYSALDLFILPSIFEGLPVVGIEAQVNGLSCIFSDCITEEVKCTKNVIFIPLKQEMWLKEIYASSIQQKKLQRDIRVDDKFNIKIQASRLLSFYENILASEPPF